MPTYYYELNGGRIQTTAKFSGGEVYVVPSGGGGGGTMQSKSVSYTPSETAISATVSPDYGYDGLSSVSVSVGAISSTYVGSNISRCDSTDLSVSGGTVTVPAGYYASNASATITPASTPVVEYVGIGNDGTLTVDIDIDHGGYIGNGTTRLTDPASVPVQAAQTIYPSTSDQTIASSKYLTGAQTIKGVTYSGLDAGNIKKDVVVKIGDSADDDRILSVTGTYEGSGGGGQKVLINESVITSDTAYIEVSDITYDNILITTNGLKTAKTSGMGALLEVQGSVCGSKTSVLFNGNVFASISSQAGFCRFEDLGNGYKIGTRCESPALPDNNMAIRYVGQSSNIAAGAYQYGDITRIKISPSESGYPFTGGTVRIYGW